MGHPRNRFSVRYRKNDLGEFTLHVPGLHNVLNATAAIAVGVGLDVNIEAIRAALDQFRGVDRRFQLRGRAAGVSVIDDYGHHPTEIKATLAAARQCGFGKVHVIFQPHRYTRTRDLIEEFTTAFDDADSLFVLDIYAASEKPIEGITGEILAQRIREKTLKSSRYVNTFAEAVDSAAAVAQDGDMILTLGAGSVSQLGPMILDKLKERESKRAGLIAYRIYDLAAHSLTVRYLPAPVEISCKMQTVLREPFRQDSVVSLGGNCEEKAAFSVAGFGFAAQIPGA